MTALGHARHRHGPVGRRAVGGRPADRSCRNRFTTGDPVREARCGLIDGSYGTNVYLSWSHKK